jgi:hypothetical protein
MKESFKAMGVRARGAFVDQCLIDNMKLQDVGRAMGMTASELDLALWARLCRRSNVPGVPHAQPR